MDKLSRKPSKWATEPVDDWLKDEGYFRKALPRDPTCLFRSVSEQIYNTQFYHARVRKECVEFMRDNAQFFEENISDSLEEYLEQMSCIIQPGGINEIEAISRLYKREVIIFHANSMIKTITTHGYDKFINLCYTVPDHYEAVFEHTMIESAALCQSVVYQILYKNVFKMSAVDETVEKMLHDKSPPPPPPSPVNNRRHERYSLTNSIAIRGQMTREYFNKTDTNYAKRRYSYNDTVTKAANPFPYRVAKALDPNVYRNVDFDVWHELKWEARGAGWSRWNNSHLQVGGKCLVQLDFTNSHETNNNLQTVVQAHSTNDTSTSQHQLVKLPGDVSAPAYFTGHIQEMTKNQGPVVVFIEELGEKKTVPYASLKPMQGTRQLTSRFNNMSFDQNQKFNKPKWNPSARKTKEAVAGVPAGLDRVNNNKSEPTDARKDNITNNTSPESSNVKNSTVVQNKYTNPDNMSAQGGSAAVKTADALPAPVSPDKPETAVALQESKAKADVCKYNPVPSSSESNLNHREKQVRHRDNNFPPSAQSVSTQSVVQPHAAEAYYPSHSGLGGIPMYPGNLNVVCVSPDGNIFGPMSFVGGNMPSGIPPTSNGLERNQIVNLAASMSVDANGADLPYADVATLRYFFNLGVECHRNSQGWPANGLPPMNFPPPFIPAPNIMPSVPMSATPSPTSTSNESSPPQPQQQQNHHQQQQQQQQQQQPQQQQQNFAIRPNFPPNRRRGDLNPNPNRVFIPHANPRNNYPRRDGQEAPKGRNDMPNVPHDFARIRNFNVNDKSKEFNQGWDARRNGQNGRYNKRNDGRNRDGRPGQFHYEPPKPNNGSPGIHKPSNFHNENQAQKGPKAEGNFSSPIVHLNQVPRTTSGPVTPHQTPYGHQQPTIYSNVPFYGSEAEVFYPPNTNMYSVPYLTHPEANDGSNAAASYPGPPPTAPESYSTTISPLYAQIPYTLQPVYQVPAQSNPENWYSVTTGQSQQFVPYTTSIPVTQQPASVMSVAAATPSSSS